MNEREYNSAPGIRRSDLWKINESPEKYKYYQDHPLEKTPALLFGSAAHSFILEPDKFDEDYAVAPIVDRRTKEGKSEWELFCTENSNKDIISAEDFKIIQEMAAAIWRNPIANNLIYGKGKTEVPFFWIDKDTGEKCKVKLDRLVRIDRRFVVVDYKTALSAETTRFCNEIPKLGYHLQAAMYTEGVMKKKRLKYRPDFIFVVQEKKEPYSVNVIYVPFDSGVMLYGQDQFRELLGILHQCKLTDNWYGFTGAFGDMNEAFLPGYIQIGEGEN